MKVFSSKFNPANRIYRNLRDILIFFEIQLKFQGFPKFYFHLPPFGRIFLENHFESEIRTPIRPYGCLGFISCANYQNVKCRLVIIVNQWFADISVRLLELNKQPFFVKRQTCSAKKMQESMFFEPILKNKSKPPHSPAHIYLESNRILI